MPRRILSPVQLVHLSTTKASMVFFVPRALSKTINKQKNCVGGDGRDDLLGLVTFMGPSHGDSLEERREPSLLNPASGSREIETLRLAQDILGGVKERYRDARVDGVWRRVAWEAAVSL